jgi:uncharacterized protein YcbX
MKALVSEINIFPIKSCQGASVRRSAATGRGFELDRQWLVVREDGEFVTQRQLPKMSQIRTSVLAFDSPFRRATMEINAPGMPPLLVNSTGQGEVRSVRVWSDSCEATDEGKEVAAWFSNYLETKCGLVRFHQEFVRKVDPNYSKEDSDQVSFADGFPYLLISEASLVDLNERLDVSLPMNRFRPNIVVTGCEPFAEDTWSKIKIGRVSFDVVKPCARCVIVCIDQKNSEVGQEPLKSLSLYRKQKNKIMFGQNLIPRGRGVISVGDELQLL